MRYSPGIIYNTLATLHAPHVERQGNTITAHPLTWGHARAIARALPGSVVRRAAAAGKNQHAGVYDLARLPGWVVKIKIKTL